MAIPDFMKDTFLVFDTETAVLKDHVCEIGFSLFKSGQLFKEFGSLIRPIIPISQESEAVHKISMSDVEDQPTFSDMSMWCYNILNSASIHCAYNYEYDRKVLEAEFTRYGMKFPVKPMVDPMVFFKKWNKYNKGKSLTAAVQKYGIEHAGAHRATHDATATGNLIFKMAAVRVDFPKTVDKLISVQRKLIEDQYIDFASYRKRSGGEEPDKPDYSLYEVQL